MTVFFGHERLTRIEDWQGLAGDGKWVAGRSAYELAHAWQAAGGLPKDIRDTLERSGHDELRGLDVELSLVEKPVFRHDADGLHPHERGPRPRPQF